MVAMADANEVIVISIDGIVKATRKAYLIMYQGIEYWLPKSQIYLNERDDGKYSLDVPKWLAKRKGMIQEKKISNHKPKRDIQL